MAAGSPIARVFASGVRTIGRSFRQDGMRGVFRRVRRRIRHSSDRLLYMRVLAQPVGKLQPSLRPDVRRFVAPTDEFSATYRAFPDDTSLAGRFDGRGFCDVAFVSDEPVAFLWTSLSDWEIHSLNALLQTTSKDALLTETYTKPEHRRKGIAEFLRNSVCEELSALGYERVFGLSHVRNSSMLQLATKTGFVPYYRISMRRLAPVERLIATPCRPEYAGGLRVHRAGPGLLPLWPPRWALTLMSPAA